MPTMADGLAYDAEDFASTFLEIKSDLNWYRELFYKQVPDKVQCRFRVKGRGCGHSAINTTIKGDATDAISRLNKLKKITPGLAATKNGFETEAFRDTFREYIDLTHCNHHHKKDTLKQFNAWWEDRVKRKAARVVVTETEEPAAPDRNDDYFQTDSVVTVVAVADVVQEPTPPPTDDGVDSDVPAVSADDIHDLNGSAHTHTATVEDSNDHQDRVNGHQDQNLDSIEEQPHPGQTRSHADAVESYEAPLACLAPVSSNNSIDANETASDTVVSAAASFTHELVVNIEAPTHDTMSQPLAEQHLEVPDSSFEASCMRSRANSTSSAASDEGNTELTIPDDGNDGPGPGATQSLPCSKPNMDQVASIYAQTDAATGDTVADKVQHPPVDVTDLPNTEEEASHQPDIFVAGLSNAESTEGTMADEVQQSTVDVSGLSSPLQGKEQQPDPSVTNPFNAEETEGPMENADQQPSIDVFELPNVQSKAVQQPVISVTNLSIDPTDDEQHQIDQQLSNDKVHSDELQANEIQADATQQLEQEADSRLSSIPSQLHQSTPDVPNGQQHVPATATAQDEDDRFGPSYLAPNTLNPAASQTSLAIREFTTQEYLVAQPSPDYSTKYKVDFHGTVLERQTRNSERDGDVPQAAPPTPHQHNTRSSVHRKPVPETNSAIPTEAHIAARTAVLQRESEPAPREDTAPIGAPASTGIRGRLSDVFSGVGNGVQKLKRAIK